MRLSDNIQRLEVVLLAIGKLSEQLVFTGGAVVELYLENPAQMRPTKDIDCILAVNTLVQYHAFEEVLFEQGFENAGFSEPGSPICRYKYKDILLDIMPTNKAVLGFTNRWFKEAFDNPISISLPSGRHVRLASLPYMLAIKLEAMINRANSDFRTSRDLEDLVLLFDGRKNSKDQIEKAPKSVRHYIQNTLTDLLENSNFLEAIRACSPDGFEQANRVLNIFKSVNTTAL